MVATLLIIAIVALFVAGFVISGLCIQLRYHRDMHKLYKDGYDRRGESFEKMSQIARECNERNFELIAKLAAASLPRAQRPRAQG